MPQQTQPSHRMASTPHLGDSPDFFGSPKPV